MWGIVWYVAVSGGTQARSKRWLVFIVLLTADISANFVCEIPNPWSSVCLCWEASNSTKTPLCNGVGYCPQPTYITQCILKLSRKNNVFTSYHGHGVAGPQSALMSLHSLLNNHANPTFNCPQQSSLWSHWATICSRSLKLIGQIRK